MAYLNQECQACSSEVFSGPSQQQSLNPFGFLKHPSHIRCLRHEVHKAVLILEYVRSSHRGTLKNTWHARALAYEFALEQSSLRSSGGM